MENRHSTGSFTFATFVHSPLPRDIKYQHVTSPQGGVHFMDPYEYHMDLCSELCSSGQAGQLAVLCGKNFTVGRNMQTFQPIVFISV